MAELGERIEDALSGATIVFRQTAVETDGGLLQLDVSARPRWSAGPLHIHPRQKERVRVVAGRLRSRVRPALRTESLFQTFFGVGPGRRTAARLRDLVRLLVATRGYRDEMRIAWCSLI